MKKIKSTKSFKAAVDETFDVQELRDEKKRQYEDLRKDLFAPRGALRIRE